MPQLGVEFGEAGRRAHIDPAAVVAGAGDAAGDGTCEGASGAVRGAARGAVGGASGIGISGRGTRHRDGRRLAAGELGLDMYKMREKLAEAFGMPLDAVSVKATTEEHLGFTGEGLGIAVHAVALIETL